MFQEASSFHSVMPICGPIFLDLSRNPYKNQGWLYWAALRVVQSIDLIQFPIWTMAKSDLDVVVESRRQESLWQRPVFRKRNILLAYCFDEERESENVCDFIQENHIFLRALLPDRHSLYWL